MEKQNMLLLATIALCLSVTQYMGDFKEVGWWTQCQSIKVPFYFIAFGAFLRLLKKLHGIKYTMGTELLVLFNILPSVIMTYGFFQLFNYFVKGDFYKDFSNSNIVLIGWTLDFMAYCVLYIVLLVTYNTNEIRKFISHKFNQFVTKFKLPMKTLVYDETVTPSKFIPLLCIFECLAGCYAVYKYWLPDILVWSQTHCYLDESLPLATINSVGMFIVCYVVGIYMKMLYHIWVADYPYVWVVLLTYLGFSNITVMAACQIIYCMCQIVFYRCTNKKQIRVASSNEQVDAVSNLDEQISTEQADAAVMVPIGLPSEIPTTSTSELPSMLAELPSIVPWRSPSRSPSTTSQRSSSKSSTSSTSDSDESSKSTERSPTMLQRRSKSRSFSRSPVRTNPVSPSTLVASFLE